MSELSELSRHLRRLWTHRALRSGRLKLPKPIDLVVMTHNRISIFEEFLDAMLSRTRWPLRMHICDGASTDPKMLGLLNSLQDKQVGPHSIHVHFSPVREFPDGFNGGLREVQGGIFAVSDPDVIVPDLGSSTCWATEVLKTMQAFPHVGWLALNSRQNHLPGVSPARSRSVRGTDNNVIAYPCETQLAIMRRDLFRSYNGDYPQFTRLFRDDVNPQYAVGIMRDLYGVQRGWNYPYHAMTDELKEMKSSETFSVDLRFYIITRTHRRPNFFRRCRESLERQTCFSRIVHVVTYSDDADLEYIPQDCVRVKVEAKPQIPCYYETYITAALQVCDDGHLVMVLDDDDYLCNKQFVETMLKASGQVDAVFGRVGIRPGSLVPKRLPFENPIYGDIASCGWVLRTEIAKREAWKPGHAQDFGYINHIFRFQLLNQQRIAWSPSLFARTQAGVSGGKSSTMDVRQLDYSDERIRLFA